MTIKEIYNQFDKIGSVVFATIDEGYPETRIAHFFAYDDKGLYFRTMTTKPFYHQLKSTKKVSVCGLYGGTDVLHDDEGLPVFNPGYTVRVTGDCNEVRTAYVKEKSLTDDNFLMGYKDIVKYPALRAFVIKSGRGEVFDYDFDKIHRDHKLIRTQFTFNEFTYPDRGLSINKSCVNCSLCFKACSFDAISKGKDHYEIDPNRCDMCGDCTLVCNFDAIDIKIT